MTTEMTMKEWEEAEPVVVPWEGEETGMVLKEMIHSCPECGAKLEEPRGRIYEVMGVVEIRLGEVCRKCSLLVESRERLYPNTGVLMRMEQDGTWRRFQMERARSRAWRAGMETLRSMPFVAGGFGIAVLMSMAIGSTNGRTMAMQAVAFVSTMGLMYVLHFWKEGR